MPAEEITDLFFAPFPSKKAVLTEAFYCLACVGEVFILSTPQGFSQTSNVIDRSTLRVCADPANMPFSNKRQQGFENKIANLLGEKLGLPVVYTWFPQTIGFIRNKLRSKKCDIVMGIPRVMN